MNMPTVVLVHGAFAEAASWNGVITRLADYGVRSMAPPNELRSVPGDAANLSAVLASIDSPVVLVGHSYGGAVTTNAVASNVRGLVYIAGFAPDTGENIGELSARLPGSTLGENVYAVRQQRPLHPAGRLSPAILRRRGRRNRHEDVDHPEAVA